MMTEPKEKWGSRIGFVLATIGSAVGLGSIWKFPYEVGENGGSGFVLLYLAGLALIVTPLMLAEFAIGRAGGRDARKSMEILAAAHRAPRSWRDAGTLGVVASALILSFYSVVGGWALAYAVETPFLGLPGSGIGEAQQRFDALLGSPGRIGLYHSAFMAFTAVIVGRGVAAGIEAAAKFLMPLLVCLMLAVAAYALAVGDVSRTLAYLFAFDLDRMTARTALEAVGLGFFSIGVGLAVMATYAAYAERSIDLKSAAVWAILSDTAISFLAGFAIFPIVFANGLDPASGPGLMFVTLPLAFSAMPAGGVVAFAFFTLLFVAALVSAISMLEMPVAFAHSTFGWSRRKAVAVSAAAIWLAGFLSVFSFNLWRDWFPLSAYPIFASSTFFDLIDYLTSSIMLPLGGLAISVFAGWVLPREVLKDALGLGGPASTILYVLLRYVVPPILLAVTAAPLIFAGR